MTMDWIRLAVSVLVGLAVWCSANAMASRWTEQTFPSASDVFVVRNKTYLGVGDRLRSQGKECAGGDCIDGFESSHDSPYYFSALPRSERQVFSSLPHLLLRRRRLVTARSATAISMPAAYQQESRGRRSEWRIPILFLSLSLSMVGFGCCWLGWDTLCRLRNRFCLPKDLNEMDQQSAGDGGGGGGDIEAFGSQVNGPNGDTAYQEYKDKEDCRDDGASGWRSSPQAPPCPSDESPPDSTSSSPDRQPSANPWSKEISNSKTISTSGQLMMLHRGAKLPSSSSHGPHSSSSASSSLSSASPVSGQAYISGLSRLSTLTSNSILEESSVSTESHGISGVLEETAESLARANDDTSDRGDELVEDIHTGASKVTNCKSFGNDADKPFLLGGFDDRLAGGTEMNEEHQSSGSEGSRLLLEQVATDKQYDHLIFDNEEEIVTSNLCGMQSSLLMAMMSSPFPSTEQEESDAKDGSSDEDSGLNATTSGDDSDLTDSDAGANDANGGNVDELEWSDSNISEASNINEDDDEDNGATTRTPRLMGEDISLRDGDLTVKQVNGSFGFFALSSDSFDNLGSRETIEMELEEDSVCLDDADEHEPAVDEDKYPEVGNKPGSIREIYFFPPSLLNGDYDSSVGIRFVKAAAGPLRHPTVESVTASSPLAGRLYPGDSIVSISGKDTYGCSHQQVLQQLVVVQDVMSSDESGSKHNGATGGAAILSGSTMIKLTLLEGDKGDSSSPLYA